MLKQLNDHYNFCNYNISQYFDESAVKSIFDSVKISIFNSNCNCIYFSVYNSIRISMEKKVNKC